MQIFTRIKQNSSGCLFKLLCFTLLLFYTAYILFWKVTYYWPVEARVILGHSLCLLYSFECFLCKCKGNLTVNYSEYRLTTVKCPIQL